MEQMLAGELLDDFIEELKKTEQLEAIKSLSST